MPVTSKTDSCVGNDASELTETEIAARFESTVRRMANTPPQPKADKKKPVKKEKS